MLNEWRLCLGELQNWHGFDFETDSAAGKLRASELSGLRTGLNRLRKDFTRLAGVAGILLDPEAWDQVSELERTLRMFEQDEDTEYGQSLDREMESVTRTYSTVLQLARSDLLSPAALSLKGINDAGK